MKKLLHKILADGLPVTEYATITVPGAINEKVFFECRQQRLDVSSAQWLLCLQPMVFGVWISSATAGNFTMDENTNFRLLFMATEQSNTPVAIVTLSLLNRLEKPGGVLLLLKLVSASSHHLGALKENLFFQRYYKRPGLSFEQLTAFAAAYSYPRRVRLVSCKDGDYYNMFPMDLTGDISQHGYFVFGLRHTNASLKTIIATGKLVIAETDARYKETIYGLGKHHASPLSGGPAPFQLLHTDAWKFPVAEWSCAYKEIEITSHISLGSHMLLWGQIVHEKSIASCASGHLFHIHFLHHLYLHKKAMAYPLV